MKSHPHSHSLLILVVLVLTLLLSSCKQLGLFNSPSAGNEISDPGNFDPELELVSDYLICPTIPNTAPVIPPGPYDEELGDCALRGKSNEIEAWLVALEEIAASCLANREPNWADNLAFRSALDIKVDEMEVSQPDPTITPVSDLSAPGLAEEMGPMCPTYQGLQESFPPVGGVTPSTHHYTAWLMSIAEDVENYCIMIDEIVKPLWQACDEINFYQDCQETNKAQYHAIINASMNTATTNYEYSDFFYNHTLQVTGWGNFRSVFSETSLDCPLDPQAPSPTFTFSTNTFGRFGPSSEYQKEFTFLELQSVKIIGRNNSEPPWWLVVVPGTGEHVWVSDSTGTALGILEDLQIVPDPPLLNNRECSKDMSESVCVDAGGTWAGKDTPTPYCDCP